MKIGDTVTYKQGIEGRGVVEAINSMAVTIRTWENTDDPEGETIVVSRSKVWLD